MSVYPIKWADRYEQRADARLSEAIVNDAAMVRDALAKGALPYKDWPTEPEYTLVFHNYSDQRIFRDKDWNLYLVDRSGHCPDTTDDGPLQVVPPKDITGGWDGGVIGFQVQVRVMRYVVPALSLVNVGLNVARWLAAYYDVPLRMAIHGHWFEMVPMGPMENPPPRRPGQPERRITL